MVSSQEEFVLLLKKWRSASVQVGLLFKTDASSEMPLSTAMVFVLPLEDGLESPDQDMILRAQIFHPDCS